MLAIADIDVDMDIDIKPNTSEVRREHHCAIKEAQVVSGKYNLWRTASDDAGW